MKALEKASAYLSARPKTKMQVIKYLRDKGYEESEIEDAVSQLEEYHFIDDFNFSVMFFELGFEKGRGVGRIKRELEEKGVDRFTIEEAYQSLEDVPDQKDMAVEIGMQAIRGVCLDDLGYDEKQKLRAKIARRLAGRGFSPDIAYSTAKQLIK